MQHELLILLVRIYLEGQFYVLGKAGTGGVLSCWAALAYDLESWGSEAWRSLIKLNRLRRKLGVSPEDGPAKSVWATPLLDSESGT